MKRYWVFYVGGLLLGLQFYATTVGSGNVFHVERLPAAVMATNASGRESARLIAELTYKARANATVCDTFVYGSYLSIVAWGVLGGVLLIQRRRELLRGNRKEAEVEHGR